MIQSFGQLITEFERHPGEVATIRIAELTVGALLRRRVRAAFAAARVFGAQVEVAEQHGLLNSVFSARLQGTACQLLPAVRALATLEQGGTP